VFTKEDSLNSTGYCELDRFVVDSFVSGIRQQRRLVERSRRIKEEGSLESRSMNDRAHLNNN
jgi:hypothetical protein